MKKFFVIAFAVCLFSISTFAGILDSPGVTGPPPACQPGQVSTADAPCSEPTPSVNSQSASESSDESDESSDESEGGLLDFVGDLISTIL